MFSKHNIRSSVNYFLLDKGKRPVWSFSEKPDYSPAVLLNLSPFGGKLLTSLTPLNQGDSIVINIPSAESRIKCKLEIHATVATASHKTACDYTEIFCKFINNNDETKLLLMEIIRNRKTSLRNLLTRCEIKTEQQIINEVYKNP